MSRPRITTRATLACRVARLLCGPFAASSWPAFSSCVACRPFLPLAVSRNRSGPKESERLTAAASASPFTPLGNEACWTCLPARVRREGRCPCGRERWPDRYRRRPPRCSSSITFISAGDGFPSATPGHGPVGSGDAGPAMFVRGVNALADLRAAGAGEVFIGALTAGTGRTGPTTSAQ